ncbi:MAG: DUF6600 domain-containing protein [Caulobacteraceae bacterium]
MNMKACFIGLMTTAAASVLATNALGDPPGRVGRIAYVEGEVSFQPPRQDLWTDATRNFPVTDSEAFWTGDGGRAELQIGPVEARLDNETELDVVDLRYGDMRLALPQGSVDVRLWSAPRGGVVISTPAGEVHLDQRGLYRVDVGATDDGSYPPVEVTVFEGAAGAPGPDGFASVEPGEAALAWAGYDPQMQDAEDATIDDWGRDREAEERWRAHPDIPVALTGFEDLDGAGDFVADPDYGEVWFPRDVPEGWAPYRFGRWAYVEPWGYTWIDDEPWGFAPFHYGRWAEIDGRWGWIPGRTTAEPVYAPALVAFIGGADWSVGGGEEAVGWVPLAPDEVYRPPYEVSETYIRQVNVNNVSVTTVNNITNLSTTNVTVSTYRNAPAATVVGASAFSGARSVQRATLPVTGAMIATAPPLTAARAPLPPPAPAARAGVVARAVAPGRTAAAPPTAPRPPARLQAVRAAVVAAPPNANRPPVVAGARIAPAPPRPPAGGPPRLIAPAQVRNPAQQGRQVVARPSSASPPAAYRAPRPRAAPFEPNRPPRPPPPPEANMPEQPARPPAPAARNMQGQRQGAEPAAREADAQRQVQEARARAQAQAQARGAQAQARARAQAAAEAQQQAADQARARAARQAQAAAQAKARAEEQAKKRKPAPGAPTGAPQP